MDITNTPLNKDIIQQIVPSSTLDDLATNIVSAQGANSDIENDIDILLEWLRPFWPSYDVKRQEPSMRIKTAIKSCLKEEGSQLSFIRLYSNSVTGKFYENFKVRVRNEEQLLSSIMEVERIKNYFEDVTRWFHLGRLLVGLFNRRLNALFRSTLVDDKETNFLQHLAYFFEKNLFSERANLGNPYIHGCIRVLYLIDMGGELKSIITELSIRKIKDYVCQTCSRVWNTPVLDRVNQWIYSEIYPCINAVAEPTTSNDASHSYMYDLIKISHDELVSLRITEIFDMTVRYPHSLVALSELHQCILFNVSHSNYGNLSNTSFINSKSSFELENDDSSPKASLASDIMNIFSSSQAHQRAKLVDSFIQCCYENLLHPGANTVDIIKAYTATIKAFLVVDPKGVLLDKVIRPIRRYLKNREDTIIKLVHGMLNQDKNNELHELASNLKKKKNPLVIDDLMEINWVPDPVDALPDFKKDKVTDIADSLISIFDLKDVFLNEFTSILSEKLLSADLNNLESVEEHLALLKGRFGENQFSALDVMVRDIKESREISSKIGNSYNNFQSTILSYLYWPILSNSDFSEHDSLRLPDSVLNQFAEYNCHFEKAKSGRNLRLLSNLGLVTLEIQRGNESSIFRVKPFEASLVLLFDEKSDQLSVEQLASILNIPVYSAHEGAEFWAKQGILKKTREEYYIAND